MSELVQEFAKTTTFKYFYSTLMRFDADLNCFVSTDKLRDRDAELLTAAWWMFQERQTKFYEMKAQLNNMETCYIEKKKEAEELQGRLKTWKGKSLAATLHGTCKCGEPWQSIISDREGFNLLHCFNCNNDRYENKEFFGDHEPKSMRGAND